MRMQDRLNDVLQSHALPHDLIAAGDLPAEGLRRSSGIQTSGRKPLA
jgi:hypothetical protein